MQNTGLPAKMKQEEEIRMGSMLLRARL